MQPVGITDGRSPGSCRGGKATSLERHGEANDDNTLNGATLNPGRKGPLGMDCQLWGQKIATQKLLLPGRGPKDNRDA